MKQGTGKRNLPLRIATVLLVLVMLSVYLLSGMMAKFQSSASGDDSVSVALIDVEGTGEYESKQIIFADMKPGDTKSYDFAIKGNSEVSVKCSAEIETTANLPLSFVIKQGDNVMDMNNLCSFSFEERSEAFTLYASWDEDDKDGIYKDEIDAIRIIVTAEQLD